MADDETETSDEPAEETSTDDTESTDAPTEDTTAEKPKGDSEVSKLRKEAAKYRTDLRKAEKELADAKAAGLTEAEKAIADAKAAGAAEATSAMSTKLVAAELRAAGVPTAMVEDLDLAKFIGDDGEIDDEKVAAAGKKYAPSKNGNPDLKQGVRGNNGPSLEQQIADAKKAGDVMAVIRLENSRMDRSGQ